MMWDSIFGFTILNVFITQIKAIVEKVAQRFLINFAFDVLNLNFSGFERPGEKLSEERRQIPIPFLIR
jgi:hypothetical protein